MLVVKRGGGGGSILQGDIKLIKSYKRFDQCYKRFIFLFIWTVDSSKNPKKIISFQKKILTQLTAEQR